MTIFTLTRPVTCANGAIFQAVDIRPLLTSDLAKIGDDIRTVTRHFLAAAEAHQRGEGPVLAGNAEYASMLAIIREMTNLGDDAPLLHGADLDGLVAAVLFSDEATPGE